MDIDKDIIPSGKKNTVCLTSNSGIAETSSVKDCVETSYFSLSLATFSFKSSISFLKFSSICLIDIVRDNMKLTLDKVLKNKLELWVVQFAYFVL